MRGRSNDQPSMLMLVSPESFVPKDHPIRGIKALADESLRAMSPVFDEMYAGAGRPSVPPERLLKASLLIAFYSVRSERQFCEQLQYNFLFRWFLDMDMDEEVFDHSTFSQNRERLIKHDVAGEFFRSIVEQARLAKLMSADHFTVDGTLIEAWASLKSFRPKDKAQRRKPDDDDKGNPTVNFRGEKRGNETHQSTTDPESKLARKSNGTTAKLSFAGHALMENRNGLLVDVVITQATGTSERDAALAMLMRSLPDGRRITLAGDKAYDTRGFVDDLRLMNVTPHVAANTTRQGGSAIDERTRRHVGYGLSQKARKLIEEFFGWGKTVGGIRKTRYRGVARTNMAMTLVGAAYNLIRMAKLMTTPG